MKLSSKIIAMLLAVALSGMSLAQDKTQEEQLHRHKKTLLTAAAVVAGTVLMAVGGGKALKYIDAKKAEAKAAQEAVRKAEEARRYRQKVRKAERQEARQLERRAQRREARPLERKAKREKEAAEIRKSENAAADLIKQHSAVIERSELLSQRARNGDKLSVDELRAIHDGRVAALEIDKAEKIAALHKEYPEYHSPEEMAAAVVQRDSDIAEIKNLPGYSSIDSVYRGSISDIHTRFDNKYPKHAAIEALEREHQKNLEYQHRVYELAKDLTDGFPKVKYSPELMEELSAIISETSIAAELDDLVALGNLQEVVWKLKENGFSSEAEEITTIIEDTLMNGEIVSRDERALSVGATKPLLVKFKNGLKGVFKGDYGHYDKWRESDDWPQREIAAHRLDKLLGLNIFPITVPRKLTDNEGSIQLFIDSASNDFRNQYIAYHELIGEELYLGNAVDNAKNFTFFKLTADRDGDAYVFNNIQPVAGRMIKIDAEQAFYLTYESAGESLLKRPQEFYTAPDFIAHLDSITTAELEEIFQPLFSSERANGIATALHENIRSYVDAAQQISLQTQ